MTYCSSLNVLIGYLFLFDVNACVTAMQLDTHVVVFLQQSNFLGVTLHAICFINFGRKNQYLKKVRVMTRNTYKLHDQRSKSYSTITKNTAQKHTGKYKYISAYYLIYTLKY